MRVVFTGGRGLIGRWAVDRLVRAGHDVLSIVRERDPSTPGLLAAQEEIVGDAGDEQLVRRACVGADGLVHLAAIPAPVGHTAGELMAANTLTTMTVLEAAGDAGVRGVVLASSVSALGMAWSEEVMSPLYLPVDEEHPLRPTEGYALSKECDEAAARMAARRWGMRVFALRFPFTQTPEAIADRIADPTQRRAFAKELWGYLDVRDAADAVLRALEAAVVSSDAESTVLNIIADDVCLDGALVDLVREWHPSVGEVRRDLRCAYDISRAEAAIGFRARHLVHNAY